MPSEYLVIHLIKAKPHPQRLHYLDSDLHQLRLQVFILATKKGATWLLFSLKRILTYVLSNISSPYSVVAPDRT